MKQSTFRIWSSLHTWTSLISTAFLLMLCITGLPLIFHDELDSVLHRAPCSPPTLPVRCRARTVSSRTRRRTPLVEFPLS